MESSDPLDPRGQGGHLLLDSTTAEAQRSAGHPGARAPVRHLIGGFDALDRTGPADDVTFAYNPSGRWTSKRQMSANGRTSHISLDDLETVGDRYDVAGYRHIIDEVLTTPGTGTTSPNRPVWPTRTALG